MCTVREKGDQSRTGGRVEEVEGGEQDGMLGWARRRKEGHRDY